MVEMTMCACLYIVYCSCLSVSVCRVSAVLALAVSSGINRSFLILVLVPRLPFRDTRTVEQIKRS